MNHTENKKDRNRFAKGVLETLLILLILLTLLSTILLAIRLVNFITIADKEFVLQSNMDENLEIFSVQYYGPSGEITVSGVDGEHVVAPGTSKEITIHIQNSDRVALDYDMIPEVNFTSEYKIPILVRLIAPDGSYIVGDEETVVSVETLNTLCEQRTLKKGERAQYVFQWMWEFESGNDAYDTALGSASVTEDIGLSVEFTVHAEANTDIGANGGFMQSGLGCLVFWGLFWLLLILLLILLIRRILKKKKEKEQLPTDETTPNVE